MEYIFIVLFLVSFGSFSMGDNEKVCVCEMTNYIHMRQVMHGVEDGVQERKP